MLEPFGVTTRDEELYQALLQRPRSTADHLADETGQGIAAVRRGLRRLEELGVVSRLAGQPVRFLATRPDTAVTLLIARRQEEFAQAQVAAQELLHKLPVETEHSPENLIEIVEGRQAVVRRVTQLVDGATEEMVMLDRPPYADVPAEASKQQLECMARGVRWRGIYAPESFDLAGQLERVEQLAAAGEHARIYPVVPIKLAIADRRTALVPLLEGTNEYALVVHGATLVDALMAMFDLLWELAVPLPTYLHRDRTAGDYAGEDEQHARLVTLLASGLSDKAIARQLGTSPRTLSRQLSSLMATLGARTRFQAGLQAAYRGYV